MRDRLTHLTGPLAVALVALVTLGVWAGVFLTWSDEPSATAELTTAAPSRDPEPAAVTLVLGDSTATSAGAGAPERGWVRLLVREAGLPPVVSLARGAVGYATTSGDVECGSQFCPDLSGQLESAGSEDVAVVLVSAGRYDVPAAPEVLRREIRALFQSVSAAYPEARVVGTSPLWDASTPPPELAVIRTAVAAAVRAVEGEFVDLGQPLGGRFDLMSSDGVHPNEAGHRAVADAALSRLS